MEFGVGPGDVRGAALTFTLHCSSSGCSVSWHVATARRAANTAMVSSRTRICVVPRWLSTGKIIRQRTLNTVFSQRSRRRVRRPWVGPRASRGVTAMNKTHTAPERRGKRRRRVRVGAAAFLVRTPALLNHRPLRSTPVSPPGNIGIRRSPDPSPLSFPVIHSRLFRARSRTATSHATMTAARDSRTG